jgi:predicted transcriptional regulator
MRVHEIQKVIEGTILTGDDHENLELQMGCGSDLMSDVLSFVKPDTLLLTGLTAPQVIYAAEMVDVKVICFVRGKKPADEIIQLARNKGITLMATSLTMFESCGRLYSSGLKGDQIGPMKT